MSDDNKVGVSTRFYLWRRFNTPPFRRYALTVERSMTPDGYKIVDHDPKIADASFLANFALQLSTPQKDVRSGNVVGGQAYTRITDEPVGTLRHYHAAINRLKGVAKMNKGGPSR